MSSLFGRRAVVVGAGIGGLSVAGVLARFFEQVDVLERDRLSGFVGSRSGTPQDRHAHGLLAGGLKALDEIFPGFERDLARAGAVSVRIAEDIQYERADVGALPKRDFGLSMLCASRPLIELVLRRRALAVANIALRPECRVTEIVPSTVDGAVHGVRCDAGSGHLKSLEADLVIDASGRGALTLALLDALGWERPKVTAVGVDIRCSTAVVQIPPYALPDWKLLLTLPNTPALAPGAVLLPVEGGRWMATIFNRGATAWPETWDSFLDMLCRLTTPTLFSALDQLKPPQGIRRYGFPVSLRRHFEGLPRLPRGVLPVADALCRFNPISGMGMSSAAKQARLLYAVLERAAAEPDPIAAAQAGFMAEVESVLQTSWIASTGADLVVPGTRGERTETFAHDRPCETAFFRAVVADPVVHRAMMEVSQLLQPHSLFHEPHIMQRIEAVSADMRA